MKIRTFFLTMLTAFFFVMLVVPQEDNLSTIKDFMKYGQFWKAYRKFEEAGLLKQTSPEIKFLYSQIAIGLGYPDLAIPILEKFAEKNLDDQVVLELKGDAELMMGKDDYAKNSYKKALSLSKDKVRLGIKILFSIRDVEFLKESVHLLMDSSQEDKKRFAPLSWSLDENKDGLLNFISDEDKKKEVTLHIKEIQSADFVEVTLNEKRKAYFVFDTSAREIMIPPDLAEKINLKSVLKGVANPSSFSGEEIGDYAILPTLKVGDITYKNVWVRLIQDKFRFFDERYGKRYYKGVLPLSLFQDHDVLFYRKKDYIKLIPKGTISASSAFGVEGSTVRAMHYLSYGGTTVVMGGCESKTGPMILSTGLIRTCLNPNFFDEYPVKRDNSKYIDIASGRTGSSYSTGRVSPEDANLGGFPEYSNYYSAVRTFQNLTISFAELPFIIPAGPVSPFPMMSKTPVWGAYGRDITNQFAFFFDVTHRRMYVIRVEK